VKEEEKQNLSFLYITPGTQMPVAIEQEQGDRNGDVHRVTAKSNGQAENANESSRYWQKRYIPGGDETFEVSLYYRSLYTSKLTCSKPRRDIPSSFGKKMCSTGRKTAT
jgi:hypothetical protein